MIRIFLFITSLLIAKLSLAQDINGVVRDSRNSPVSDANIININSGNHTHTDDAGRFALYDSKVGDSLKITHLGYESRYYVLDQAMDVVITLEPAMLELNEVLVKQEINSLHNFSEIDLKINPVNSSQEILQFVPGLIIGQHAGGGKAEQIFLRGFDIDHGTDINITVDELPVNMVSHAHGQGYADLHFLIPETIEEIDFGKGPYNAEKGNFATAGYINFNTVDRLQNSRIIQEVGSFNTLRTVGLFNLINTEKHSAYAAGELYLKDGPFESPQDFSRINLMAKYTANIGTNRITLEGMHFQSSWNASGQIPVRAVDEGIITRFGAIDDTEGGYTSRSNFQLKHLSFPNKNTTAISRAYISNYNFELFSNFTFFLNDPVNGDQIKQKEDRTIYGLESVINHSLSDNMELVGGFGLRLDDINDNQLLHTLNRREVLDSATYGDVKESNLYAFGGLEYRIGDLLINPSLRFDHFSFYYDDKTDAIYAAKSENKAIVSPKLNIIYSPSNNLQLYLKNGIGFHSNDTRVVVEQGGQDILPRAYGTDLGTIWKPAPRVLINAAAWYLYLEQEFVYVGDEGIVEPSGKTERKGIDLSLRYQLSDEIFLNTNINYSHARAIEEPDGSDYIPLAPDLTSSGGLYYQHRSGLSAGLLYRFVNDRPANEDNSIIAEGYFINDLNITYSHRALTVGVVIQNIFDSEWNETQFATESRMFNEAVPVEEIHFTPGAPMFIKGRIGFSF